MKRLTADLLANPWPMSAETVQLMAAENSEAIATVEAISDREDAYKKALDVQGLVHGWKDRTPHLRLIDGYLEEFPDGKHVPWFRWKRLVWEGEYIESDGKPVRVLIDEACRFERFLEQNPDVIFVDEVRSAIAGLWGYAALTIWRGEANRHGRGANRQWTNEDAERFARKARRHLNEVEEPDRYLLKLLRRERPRRGPEGRSGGRGGSTLYWLTSPRGSVNE